MGGVCCIYRDHLQNLVGRGKMTIKTKKTTILRWSLRDSARIQTWNRLIRSQVLYSVELRSRIASANIEAFFDMTKYF